MAIAVKTAAQAAEKWSTQTPARSAYFEDGVRTTPKKWDDRTAGSESAYEQGVQQAISGKRFGKGVRRVGDTKWRERTLAVGVSRWGPGVGAARGIYESNVGPFLATIAGVTLPPKGARGSAENYNRVKAVGDALHKKRLEMLK